MDLAEDGPCTMVDGSSTSASAAKELQAQLGSSGMVDNGTGEDGIDEDVYKRQCSLIACPNRFKQDGFNCKACQLQMYCGPICAERHWPEHKLTCERLNYVLSIDLYFQKYQNNRPGRIMSCPASATFEDFYQALSLSLPCLRPFYHFVIHDKGQMFDSTIRFPRPRMIITGPETHTYMSEHHTELLPLQKDSQRISLANILRKYPSEQGQKIIHYFCRDSRIQNAWQYVILFMERAPISPFLILWSGASQCIEDYGKGQNSVTLRLAYEASKPTEEQRELLYWYDSLEDSKASREKINQALSQIRTSMRPVNIGSSHNEAEGFS